MRKEALIDRYRLDIDAILQALSHLYPKDREFVLRACLKESRERRYFGRVHEGLEEWRPVLRPGYEQYVVSNWGFVCHMNKARDRKLRPAFGHEYARAPLKAVGRNNGATQHMIHELVIESFRLMRPIPEQFRDQKNSEIINHIDGDKYHPALSNLEITDQGENMVHAYRIGLRKPRN